MNGKFYPGYNLGPGCNRGRRFHNFQTMFALPEHVRTSDSGFLRIALWDQTEAFAWDVS